MKTAGKPTTLKLDADKTLLKADGDDMAFITVSMTDAEGTLCPDADDDLLFEVTGAGNFQAVCNGDATSLEPFTQPQMKLFHGQLVLVVRASEQAGITIVTVKCPKRKIESQLKLKIG